MRQKTGPQKPAAKCVIKDIGRATRKHHSAEDKTRIVPGGLRGEDSIAALPMGVDDALQDFQFLRCQVDERRTDWGGIKPTNRTQALIAWFCNDFRETRRFGTKQLDRRRSEYGVVT